VEEIKMGKKLSIIALVVISIGLLILSQQNRVLVAAADSSRDVNARISKLEKQVSDLDKKIKELEIKANTRTVAIPYAPNYSGNKLPPGSIEREINGVKYWIMPINEGKPANPPKSAK
jgi:hypothetical protein